MIYIVTQVEEVAVNKLRRPDAATILEKVSLTQDPRGRGGDSVHVHVVRAGRVSLSRGGTARYHGCQAGNAVGRWRG